jgi:hypothetical protein
MKTTLTHLNPAPATGSSRLQPAPAGSSRLQLALAGSSRLHPGSSHLLEPGFVGIFTGWSRLEPGFLALATGWSRLEPAGAGWSHIIVGYVGLGAYMVDIHEQVEMYGGDVQQAYLNSSSIFKPFENDPCKNVVYISGFI